MDSQSYLLTCVEAGVAMSGFAAIAMALRGRSPDEIAVRDRLIVALLVERGLVGAFLALLPILLAGLVLPDRLVWLVSSGLLVAYGVFTQLKTVRNRDIAVQLGSSWLFYFLLLVATTALGIQVLNALGIGLTQGIWWYLLGITWLLVSVGYTFILFVRSWVRAVAAGT
jgi:hypothetical protein